MIFLAAPTTAAAQLSLASSGSPVSVTFAGYEGLGLAPSPLAGQLDSDTWSIRGASDGDTAWGLTYEVGDFARGPSTGGVLGGGVYAFFAAGPSDAAIGVQPTESDFTPGAAVLRMRNDTGRTLTRLDVSFEAWSYNDGDRAVSFTLEHSTDDFTWSATAASATTLDFADAFPAWSSVPFTVTISGLSVPPGAYVYLRWAVADAGGSGSRDEVAIDDVRVTPFGTTAVPDAGMPDAGTSSDAGMEPDAGSELDAGGDHDAGTERDAGAGGDAGEMLPGDDAGGEGTPVLRTGGRRGGCSAVAGAPSDHSFLGLALLALLLRRRTRGVR